MSIRRDKKMPSKMRHGLLISIAVIGLLFTSVLTSYAETVNYIYDELNRLIRVEYEDGTVILYIYDKAGNRLEMAIPFPDTTPPITTADPPGGTYNAAKIVTLSCSDGYGAGCDKIYYTTDGTTPTTSSPVYSSPITISVTATLKFFARDLAGNSETVKSEIYTIDATAPTNPTSCLDTHGAINDTWQGLVSDPAFNWSGASDSGGSGVKGYYWYFGTNPNEDPTIWTASAGCDPSAVTPGVYYLRVKTEDNAGNKSSPATLFTFKYRGWLSGWSYRKSVTLSRASGTVSNYQMKLLVGETSGATGENVDCGGHIRADFNDLRFTNSNGELLDYWIESITGTTPNQLATVWIKFDSIGTGATTFYMYYGKSDATAYSNGDNTFIFFDDFPGTTINTNKWGSSIPAGGSSITVASSIAKVKVVVPAGAHAWTACILYAKSNWNRPFAVRAKWKEYDSNNCWAGYYPFSALYKDYYNQIAFERNNNNSRLWVKNVGATRTEVTSEFWNNDSNYHILDFMFGSSAWSAYIDGTQKVNANGENTLLNSCSLRLQAAEYYQTLTSEQWFDYVFVRNYVSSGSEPAWGTWGAEEPN
jgi:YD repeat-containing protein